ncbi:acyltransferase [Bradyrhizobium sp. UFLA05-109]
MTQLISRFETGEAAAARPQLVSIQYLRALAALMVLVTHALYWPLESRNEALLVTGRLGVEIFFVLSGFIITVIGGEARFEPIAFARNRILRIVPMYWVATLLVVGLATASPSSFLTTVPTTEGIIKSLLFIPSDMPKAPLLRLGWTLDYEAFFYLVFGSLFFVRSATRTALLAILFVGLIVIGRVIDQPSHVQDFYTSPSLLGFLVGAGVGRLYQLGLLQRLGRIQVLGLLAAGALSLSVLYRTDPDVHLLLFHLSMSFGAMTIVVAVIWAEEAGRLPVVPAFRFLGDASYSLYLFHFFAMAAAWAIGRKLFGPVSAFNYAPLAVAAIAAGLTAGCLAYWYLERPILNWTRQRRRPAVVTQGSTP